MALLTPTSRRSSLATPALCALLTLLASFVASAQADDRTPPPWEFTDPKDDPLNPLRYIANNTLSAVAICAYLSAALRLFFCLRVVWALARGVAVLMGL
ncbi:hypothetical protein ACG7TL_000894 [Trametes sanguinea]